MIASCLACLLLSTVVNVSDEVEQTAIKPTASHRNTLIMLQPIPLISNWAIVTIESAFSDKMSGTISLGAAYRKDTQNTQQFGVGSYDAINRSVHTSLEAGCNYFFEGSAPRGFWLGPRVTFRFVWNKYSSNYNPTSTDGWSSSNTWRDYVVGGSLLFGFNAILRSGLTFQVGLGVGATYDWTSGAGLTAGYIPATSGVGLFFSGPGSSANAIEVSGRGLFGIGWGA